MTTVKKGMRFIAVMTLSIIVAFSFSTTVLANSVDGRTTWYLGQATSSEMNINGYNLTPVKTMGASGTLNITQTFLLSDLSSNSNTALCTLEIRNTSGAVLGRVTGITSTNTLTFGARSLSLTISVNKGQQIQLYSSVYDTSTGYARRAKSTYTYTLTS